MSDPRVEALNWAATVLAAPVVDVDELTGGLTSTMLAISAGDGTRAVLRLMTEEPWRHHGAELTRRERQAMHDLASTPCPLRGASRWMPPATRRAWSPT